MKNMHSISFPCLRVKQKRLNCSCILCIMVMLPAHDGGCVTANDPVASVHNCMNLGKIISLDKIHKLQKGINFEKVYTSGQMFALPLLVQQSLSFMAAGRKILEFAEHLIFCRRSL